jgi:small subunit ribosomal protein S15
MVVKKQNIEVMLMARMHTRRHGKSGRKRPKAKVAPSWVQFNEKDTRELIVELAKKGTPPSQIGIILRDQYAIPSVKALTGKTITQILEEEQLLPEYPEDLLNLIKKAVRMRQHLEKNKRDIHNKVRLGRVEAKIHRLVMYYRRTGRIPKDWKYTPESAALLVR